MKNVMILLTMAGILAVSDPALSQVTKKNQRDARSDLQNIHNDKYLDKYQYQNNNKVIVCKSNNGRRAHCRADTRYGVNFLKQISRANCDYNWGYDDTGIWVDRGCAAEFKLNYGWDQSGSEHNVVACSSYNFQREHCPAYLNGREVFILNQLSNSSCLNNWGYDRNGVWVTNGCRAEFVVEDRFYDRDGVITCSSRNQRFQSCQTNTNNGIEFIRQLSRKSCNGNWGYDNQGIWVKNGCRAQFRVTQSNSTYQNADTTIRCSSKYHRRKFCNADTSGGVRLVKQRSKSPCRGNWGYDAKGIWVDNGCRASFQLHVNGYNNNQYDGNRNNPRNNGRLRPNNRNNGRTNTPVQQTQKLVCESRNRRKNTCQIPYGSTVRLSRKLSKQSCGNNWGYDKNQLWVSNGCRAEFSITH